MGTDCQAESGMVGSVTLEKINIVSEKKTECHLKGVPRRYEVHVMGMDCPVVHTGDVSGQVAEAIEPSPIFPLIGGLTLDWVMDGRQQSPLTVT